MYKSIKELTSLYTLEELKELLAYTEDDKGCWVFKYDKDDDGYGIIYLTKIGISVKAHRLAYFVYKGIDPVTTLVCHNCDQPPCINFNHLNDKDNKGNTQDMLSRGRKFEQKKTHCINGHEFSSINTYKYKNKRVCRRCQAETRLRNKDKIKKQQKSYYSPEKRRKYYLKSKGD